MTIDYFALGVGILIAVALYDFLKWVGVLK
jgi:hypothetical protein